MNTFYPHGIKQCTTIQHNYLWQSAYSWQHSQSVQSQAYIHRFHHFLLKLLSLCHLPMAKLLKMCTVFRPIWMENKKAFIMFWHFVSLSFFLKAGSHLFKIFHLLIIISRHCTHHGPKAPNLKYLFTRDDVPLSLACWHHQASFFHSRLLKKKKRPFSARITWTPNHFGQKSGNTRTN